MHFLLIALQNRTSQLCLFLIKVVWSQCCELFKSQWGGMVSVVSVSMHFCNLLVVTVLCLEKVPVCLKWLRRSLPWTYSLYYVKHILIGLALWCAILHSVCSKVGFNISSLHLFIFWVVAFNLIPLACSASLSSLKCVVVEMEEASMNARTWQTECLFPKPRQTLQKTLASMEELLIRKGY